jgi:hypothetical protein
MFSLRGKHSLLESMVFLVSYVLPSFLFAWDEYSGICLALQASVPYVSRKFALNVCDTWIVQNFWRSVYSWTVTHRTDSVNPLTPELNPSVQRCLTRFLLGILLLEPCISLIYAWKINKRKNYSLTLLIMYGTSYMFRHYIAILRERS